MARISVIGLFVCIGFVILRLQIQSCGGKGGLTKMAAIKITWLQILAHANNRLLDPVFFLDQCLVPILI